MRRLAVALAGIALFIPAAAAGSDAHARVAFFQGGKLVVVDLATGRRTVALTHAPLGPVRWSGDGKLVSVGGRIAGGPVLPTKQLVWAPAGEKAAYQTKRGAIMVWTPARTRVAVLASWGATSMAWGATGELALGRSVCHVPCGVPRHQEVWIWRDGSMRRVVASLDGVVRPIVTGFAPNGRVLWWPDWQGSGSLAADGLPLHANGARVATTLVYNDYVVTCGTHLALAAGGDRATTHGKRIVFDGRDVSNDTSKSWVTPSCTSDATLVAAAGRNWQENRFGAEHRAIWRLLPTKRQLTQPPAGWTDESPRLLADGSVLFVRTRQTARKVNGEWLTTNRGKITLLARGKLTEVADTTFTSKDSDSFWLNFYGHYNWPWLVAVAQ